jgi:hypothetical protein
MPGISDTRIGAGNGARKYASTRAASTTTANVVDGNTVTSDSKVAGQVFTLQGSVGTLEAKLTGAMNDITTLTKTINDLTARLEAAEAAIAAL